MRRTEISRAADLPTATVKPVPSRYPLNQGQIITNDDGRRYRIDEYLGGGGFGTVFTAQQLSKNGRREIRTVCVKVCSSAADWHGEAHFGNLLAGHSEVVEMLDAFAVGSTPKSKIRYVLVSEYLREGTVAELIDDPEWSGWSPTVVHRELSRLLRLLAIMHAAGITHRDIKPDNVFLRDGHLVLGDFGISKQTLNPRRSPIDAYTPMYSPTDIEQRLHWGSWIDVYQVGLLAGALLTGTDWYNADIGHIRSLEAPEELKCWIWHATARKGLKYVDGTQAHSALTGLGKIDMRSTRGPATLHGHHVVVTGRFDTGTQQEMSRLITEAGATIQAAVNNDTSVVVRAPQIANTVGNSEGRKLYAARERKRRGQRIHIITENRLRALLEADLHAVGG